jgi:hypothetical protein
VNDSTAELSVVGATADDEVLATLDLIATARRSLAEAQTLPDIRRVIEAATVAADAGKRAARLAEAERRAAAVVQAASAAANDAAAVRIEAQAKAGELLGRMSESGERHAQRGDHVSESQAATRSLSDLGVSKSDSFRWQQVAAVPPAVRQEYVDATTAALGEVSTAGLLRHASAGPRSGEPAGLGSIDHPRIAAEARRRMRAVYRGVIELPGYRPEALVSALDQAEKRSLLRALGQLRAWIEDVTSELAIHHVKE